MLIESLLKMDYIYDLVNSIEKVLGQGPQSDTFLALKDNKKVVLKVYDPQKSFHFNYPVNDPSTAPIRAQNEFSVLKQLHSTNFPVPEPYRLSNNAFTMELILKNKEPAPISLEYKDDYLNLHRIKNEILRFVDILYNQGIVNLYANQYNILISDNRIVFIDFEHVIYKTDENNAELEKSYQEVIKQINAYYSYLDSFVYHNSKP